MNSNLELDSPVQQAMTELRRAVTLNLVRTFPCIKSIHPSDLQLREALAQAHAYDFGYLLDPRHRDCLSPEARLMVCETSRDRGIEGLILPFPQTAFLFRNLPLKTETQRSAGVLQVLVLMEQPEGIAAHHYCRLFGDCDDWGWAGSVQFNRAENNLRFLGFDPSHADREFAMRVLVNTVWTSVGLLNVRSEGEVVTRDPAPRAVKPKTFETPQPSIGVVHVNKPLLIRKHGQRQERRWKMPGHDRRQHERTYKKSGKTIIVPVVKVNGGAIAPMVKRVTIDQPI
jgi:hypothetical protein